MPYLLKEDGGKLLLENGGGLLLDVVVQAPTLGTITPAERLTGGTVLSWSIPHDATGASALVVAFAAENSVPYDPTSVTYGGAPLSLLRRYTQSNGGTVWLYGIIGPPASGSVVVSDPNESQYYGPMVGSAINVLGAASFGYPSLGAGSGLSAATSVPITTAKSLVLDFAASVFHPAATLSASSPTATIVASHTSYGNLQTRIATRIGGAVGSAATATWSVGWNYVNAISLEIAPTIDPPGRYVRKPATISSIAKTGQYAALKALFAFNETSGSSSPNLADAGDAATLAGGATYGADVTGRSLVPVSGTTLPTKTLGDWGISASAPFTIFARVAPNMFSDGNDRVAFSIGNRTAGGLTFDTYGDIIELYSGASFYDCGFRLDKGDVQTWVLTSDGAGTVKVYVNGTLAGTFGLALSFPSSARLAIGYDPAGLANFQQRIYEIGAVAALWSPTEASAYDASPLGMVSTAPAVVDHALTASAPAIAAPAPGRPALTQVQTLAASARTFGAPPLARPALAQAHALSASARTFGAVSLGAPAAAVDIAASPSSPSIAAPAPGRPALSQVQALAASSPAIAAPAPDRPTVSQVQALSATPPAVSAPAPGRPLLVQAQQLLAASVLAGAVLLGSPALSVERALAASPVTLGAPTLGSPAVSQNQALAGASEETGTPVLGSPAIAQDHAAAPSSPAIAAPAPGRPALGQSYALSPTAPNIPGPAPARPAVTQVHALAAPERSSGIPSLGSPAVAQAQALAAPELSAPSPVLGRPAPAQVHSLAGAGLVSGSPAIGVSTVSQVHALSASSLSSGAPSVPAPALILAGQLTPAAVLSGSPVLGRPVVVQVHALGSGEVLVGSPAPGRAALAQGHALSTASRSTGAPVLGRPVAVNLPPWTVVPVLTARAELGRPALVQEHALSTPSRTAPASLGSPAVVQDHRFAASSLEAPAPVLGTPVVERFEIPFPVTVETGRPELGAPELEQQQVLRPSSLELLVDLPRLALVQDHRLRADTILFDEPSRVHALETRDLSTGAPVLGRPIGGFPDVYDPLGLGDKMIVSMAEAKAHLRVDGDDEDEDISLKLDAAEAEVLEYIQRPAPWTDASGNEIPAPAPIKASILMVLGDLYANREEGIVGASHAINPTARRLLARYRAYL